MSVADAVYRTVQKYKGGAESLAPRMGTTANVLRNKVNPNNDTHHLRLDEAVEMMALSGDAQILHAMADELGYVVVPAVGLDEFNNTELMIEFNRLYQGLGQFSARINGSLEDDGMISSKEGSSLHMDALILTSQVHAVYRQLIAVYGEKK